MKKVLAVLFTLMNVCLANGQCPPGASAVYTIWVSQTGPTTFDTTCYFTVQHFPANSQVYFYDNSSTLLDNLITDATGYGNVQRYSTNCYLGPFPYPMGTAVCGTCTTNLTSVGLLPIKLKTFSVTTIDNKVTAFWQLEEESLGTVYDLQESINRTDFSNIYTARTNNIAIPGQQYQYELPQSFSGKRFYRLKITETSGQFFYSPVKTATSKDYTAVDIYPAIGHGSFTISVSENFLGGQIQIFSTTGSMVQSQKISSFVLKFALNTGAGVYHVRVISPDGRISVKSILVQ